MSADTGEVHSSHPEKLNIMLANRAMRPAGLIELDGAQDQTIYSYLGNCAVDSGPRSTLRSRSSSGCYTLPAHMHYFLSLSGARRRPSVGTRRRGL
jgi:hypothetical protein